MKPKSWQLGFVAGVAIILVTLLSHPVAYADDGNGARYFPATGHTVQGAFLALYESIPNAAIVVGAPISEALTRRNGKIQYFQKAVFVQPWGSAQAELLPLGQEVYRLLAQRGDVTWAPAAGIGSGTLACQYFPAVQGDTLPVCGKFLPTYERYRGFLGRVVSQALDEVVGMQRTTVQYFEYGRLELRLGAQNDWQATLSPLGELYFSLQGEDPALLDPRPPSNNAPAFSVTSLQVLISVEHLTLHQNESQTIYITVLDQIGQPVTGAAVQVDLCWLDDHADVSPEAQTVTTVGALGEKCVPVGEVWTDAEGRGTVKTVAPATMGHIEIEVQVEAQGVTAHGKSSFRVWW